MNSGKRAEEAPGLDGSVISDAPSYRNFWSWACLQPDRPALVDAAGATCTFGQLRSRSNRIANLLRAKGLKRDDGVAMLVPNCIEYFEVYFACAQIGMHFTPINNHLAVPEAAYVLENCDAKLFFAHATMTSSAIAIADLARIPAIARIGIGEMPGFGDYLALRDSQSGEDPSDRCAGAAMIYSSGTTGKPKGVLRPHSHLLPDDPRATLTYALEVYGIKPGNGVFLVQGPLHHAGPWCYSTGSLQFGHRVVLMDKWDGETMLRLVERYRVTHTMMVPTMFNRLLKLPMEVRGRYDQSSLEAINHSAAPCAPATKRKMMDWFGPIIHEAYGGTEGSGTRCSPQDWLRKPGTVGRASPGIVVKIVGEDGTELPPGQVGDVYLSSLPGVSTSYYKDDEKTARSRQGSLYTIGDMGYLDEDGFLFLVDRRVDMVISGGVNIYPAEIEAALLQHPLVADVAVFGIPNEEWGEELKAVVEPIAGIAPSESLARELSDYCLQQLARYKVPRSFDFSTQLPRSDNGKIYKRLLRDPYWAGRERRI